MLVIGDMGIPALDPLFQADEVVNHRTEDKKRDLLVALVAG